MNLRKREFTYDHAFYLVLASFGIVVAIASWVYPPFSLGWIAWIATGCLAIVTLWQSLFSVAAVADGGKPGFTDISSTAVGVMIFVYTMTVTALVGGFSLLWMAVAAAGLSIIFYLIKHTIDAE
jgi:hypothetical protein